MLALKVYVRHSLNEARTGDLCRSNLKLSSLRGTPINLDLDGLAKIKRAWLNKNLKNLSPISNAKLARTVERYTSP